MPSLMCLLIDGVSRAIGAVCFKRNEGESVGKWYKFCKGQIINAVDGVIILWR